MGDDITIGVTEIVNNIEVTAQPNDQIVDINVTDNADNVTLNITPTVIEINVNKGSSYARWGSILGTLTDQTDLANALILKADLIDGLVPSYQLPSYVDDVIEVANYAALPVAGETGKIYLTLDNNHIYRWTGSTYVEITDNTAVWGAITGTLSSQTDLQNALNAKFDDPTGDTTQYIAGDGSLITFPVAGQSGTLVRQVRNTTGATLTKGTIVYINGATGNKPTVAKAIATGDSTSAQTFGMLQADLADNSNGYVVCVGDIIGLDTSAITEGTQLYLSSTTAGTYTTTKQVAPAHLVYIGVVTRSHPTLGQIEVKIQNGYELDEIHDVLITSKTNNDILTYESSSSLWKNKSIATILGYTPANDSNVVHLSGSETITGIKTFSNAVKFDFGTYLKQDTTTSYYTGYTTIDGFANGYTINNGDARAAIFTLANNASRNYTFPDANGTFALTSDLSAYALDNSVVHLAGSETITGIKTFTGSSTVFDYTGASRLIFKESGTEVGDFSFSPYFTQFTSKASEGYLFKNSVNANSLYITNSGNGTFLGSLTATSIIKSGGTSSQYLMADGSVSTLTNPVTASSATANYHAKFTGSGYAIGNSLIYDNGTNVGIGTTSPRVALEVASSNTGYYGGTGMYVSAASGSSDYVALGQYSHLFGGGGTSNAALVNNGSGFLSIHTNASERMRITSGGTALFGRTSSFSSGYSIGFRDAMFGAVTTNGNNLINFFNASDSYIASIVVNASTIVYGIGSDYRLKEDLKDFNGLEKVSKIKVYDFKFIEEGDRMEGVLAHELQDIVPYAVTGEKDGLDSEGNIKIQNVDYSKLVPILVKAIQELQEKINKLENK